MKKNVIVNVIEDMGYDPTTIDQEGYSSDALRSNAFFGRAVAELKYALMVKEDDLTADPTIDAVRRTEYREYYSLSRNMLDAVVNMLDQKIQLAENNRVPAEETQE